MWPYNIFILSFATIGCSDRSFQVKITIYLYNCQTFTPLTMSNFDTWVNRLSSRSLQFGCFVLCDYPHKEPEILVALVTIPKTGPTFTIFARTSITKKKS